MNKPAKRPDTTEHNIDNTADLTLLPFGRLIAIEIVERNGNNGPVWRCNCDCGNTVDVPSGELMRENHPTQSCGCLQKEVAAVTMKSNRKPREVKDLTGGDYERWHVVKFLRTEPKVGAVYWCKCKCGTEREVKGKYLRDGRSTSCGCLQKELAAKLKDTRS